MELLLSRFERIALEQPEYAALSSEECSLSCGEMMERVRGLAGALGDRGISSGDLVALLLQDSIEFVLTYLATLRLGAVSAPLRMDWSPAQVAARLGDLQAAFLVTSDPALRTMGGAEVNLPPTVIRLEELDPRAAAERPPAAVEESAVSAVLFTSGTGGTPHAVELTQSGLAHQAYQVAQALRIRPADRIAGGHSLAGVYGLTLQVHLPLAAGATAVVGAPAHGTGLLSWLTRVGASVYVGSPQTYVQAVADTAQNGAEASPLRYLINAGGRLSEEVSREVEQRTGRPVMCGYGTTESGGLISLDLFPDPDHRGQCGEPLGETEVAVLDEQGIRLGAGRSGQIAVRGPTVAIGYRNAPERTKQIIRDDWLITDDVGSLDYNSRLTVHGHRLESISRGGFPVYAWQVESVLSSHPAVKQAVVVGVTDPVYGEELKACVVCHNGSVPAVSELIEFVKSRLPVYKCPRIVKFYKELPNAAGGKINRGVLREDRS